MDNFMISLVSIPEELIEKVAQRANVTKEEVQQYLKSDQQHNLIFTAFAYYGVYPINKFPC